MNLIHAANYEDMAEKAAQILIDQVRERPDSVLGLATGSTPLGIYKRLIAAYEQGKLSFAAVRSINLDEYCGLSGEDSQSYRWYMRENLFRHVDIAPKNTHVPDGMAADTDAECIRYDALLRELGGTDIQLLGLGHTGHIGFNEPDEQFPVGTHRVTLAQATIDANARFFEDISRVPRHAITMGIAGIFSAKHILLCVNGADKAEILAKTLEGPVTPLVPASVLQLHPNVTVIADEAALSALKGAKTACC